MKNIISTYTKALKLLDLLTYPGFLFDTMAKLTIKHQQFTAVISQQYSSIDIMNLFTYKISEKNYNHANICYNKFLEESFQSLFVLGEEELLTC